MLVSNFTRESIAYRRARKKAFAEGFEEVGEGGGMLWELYRGWRMNQKILDVRIAPGGKSLFVRIG